jgi:ribonuclease BN (tRNA processing enzyme)
MSAFARFFLVVASVASLLLPAQSQATCPTPLAVQVLGSGGPSSDDARASSGYLLWIDGEARLLVDAGGGVFLRFGEAKAKFESLDLIALSHLHADHVSDLPAVLKSGYFTDRKRPLPIAGPSGSAAFPGTGEFMRALFDPKRGAFRYLSGYLDGSGGLPPAPVTEVDAASRESRQIFANEHFKLTAIGVTHGSVPALGFLVEVRGRRIAFSGDQNGDNPAFAAMIKGADLLIMDHAIPEVTGNVEARLHARPSEIGTLAASAGVKHLVLSHNMARSLAPLKSDLEVIKARYTGRIDVAEDLMCFE